MININRKRLLPLFFAALALSLEVGCMDKTELNENEKKILSDISEFNKTHGAKGWDLHGRQLFNVDLTGIRLFDSKWEDVGLENINFSNCEIRKSIIRNASCYQTDFSKAVMEGVKFESCDFSQTSFEGARLNKCEFIGCRAVELRMDGALTRNCVFRDLEDESGIYDKAGFYSDRFENCRFKGASFYSARFEAVGFDGGSIANSTFSGSELRKAGFKGLKIDYCSFNEVKAFDLKLSECRSEGISFGGSEVSGFEIRNCPEISVLSFSETQLTGLEIVDCDLISEPLFYLSRVENLAISSSRVDFLDGAESEYTGVNRLNNNVLHGLNLSKSKVRSMRIENSRIEVFLIISGGQFENLVLKNVEYADGLDVRADSVTYSNSDIFGE